MNSRLREIHSKLLLALASLVVAALMAELVARTVYRPPPVLRVYDPFSYRVPRPEAVEELTNLDGESVVIRLNELGMRGPNIESSAEADLTLVFLGGSTTENYSILLESTFPEIVGAELRQSLGRTVRVFNAGASAATTAVSLGRLQHQVLDLDPNLVIIMHGINDLLGGFHPGYRPDSRHLPRPVTADAQPISYLRSWILGRVRGSVRIPAAVDSESVRQLTRPGDFPSLPVYRRNLRSIAAVAAAHRIPLLLLTQPTLYELDGEARRFRLMNRLVHGGLPLPDVRSLRLGMTLFNDEVRTLQGVGGTHVFDLSSRVPRSWALFQDECHLTVAGNARVAREIGPEVERIVLGAPRADPEA